MKPIAKGLHLINIENEFVHRQFDIVLLSTPKSDPYITWQSQDDTKTFWPRGMFPIIFNNYYLFIIHYQDWLAKDFSQSRVILAECHADWKNVSVIEQDIKELLENMNRVI